MKGITIQIQEYPEGSATEGLYSVSLNGEIILECLSEDEIGELTIAEIQECALY